MRPTSTTTPTFETSHALEMAAAYQEHDRLRRATWRTLWGSALAFLLATAFVCSVASQREHSLRTAFAETVAKMRLSPRPCFYFDREPQQTLR